MRILQVVHGFPPHEWAGTELVTLQLSQALRARGQQVTVLTRTADPEAEEFSVRAEQMDGLEVVRIVNNYTHTTSFRLFYDNSFFNLPFTRLLERVRPEVVHFQHLAHLSVSLLPLTAGLGYLVVQLELSLFGQQAGLWHGFQLALFLLDEHGVYVYDQKTAEQTLTIANAEKEWGICYLAHTWEATG